jgi:hypothetical protein
MALTYRKTSKGLAEIETRAHRLTPRMRSALIFVDGRRSDGELHNMVLQQPVETLAALLEQGFIERADGAAPARPPGASQVAASASAPMSASASASTSASTSARPPALGPAPPLAVAPSSAQAATAPVAPKAAAPAADFTVVRRDAVRLLSDLIGPASESLAMRMEKARTASELRPLLELAALSVANMRGRQAAASYAQRFEGL